MYICPYSKSKVNLDKKNNVYVSSDGKTFKIHQGIPVFLEEDCLSDDENWSIDEYEKTKEYYDNAIDWLFNSFNEDEVLIRQKMIQKLNLNGVKKILEIGCGTGRDTEHIVNALSPGSTIYFQDISVGMAKIAKSRISGLKPECETNCFVSSASSLPFGDGFFDAVYSFGGFNEFPQKQNTMAEICRVVKKGGRVVFGDEQIAPWLEHSEYAKIIRANNPIFERIDLPLEALPKNAQNVNLTWLMGHAFYLIDFQIGDAPSLNMDLEHKGWRGGSLRSRYFGQLDGVSPETKKRAEQAAKSSGKSLRAWLDAALLKAVDETEEKKGN